MIPRSQINNESNETFCFWQETCKNWIYKYVSEAIDSVCFPEVCSKKSVARSRVLEKNCTRIRNSFNKALNYQNRKLTSGKLV